MSNWIVTGRITLPDGRQVDAKWWGHDDLGGVEEERYELEWANGEPLEAGEENSFVEGDYLQDWVIEKLLVDDDNWEMDVVEPIY